MNMKITLATFVLLFSTITFAGGFKWPNVKYSYAKLYLMNVTLDKPNDFDWHIYENGVYATSKIGSGTELSQDFLDDLHKSMVRGVNELRIGLGKCYMPRHGIIYYDDQGKAVAAFTACFECDKISLWSSKDLPRVDYEGVKNDWAKAEKQIEQMRSVFEKAGYPLYKNKAEYQQYLLKNKDFEDSGTVVIETESIDEIFNTPFTQSQVKGWQKMCKRSIQLTESHETEITAGGQEYHFRNLQASKGTTYFLFSSSDVDAHLVDAEITHGSIILPNGVSVGMSVEDVQVSLGLIEGSTYPEIIKVKGKKVDLEYYFNNHSLIAIKLNLSRI